jgi:RNA methyltransferase, TrmH family
MLENPRSPKVRAVAKLAKKARRKEAGLFLVEGPQAVRELLMFAPGLVQDVFLTPAAEGKNQDLVALARAGGIEVEPVTEAVLAQMADTLTPQGVLAVSAMPSGSLADLPPRPHLVVVLSSVRDPGNVGAIIRVADAVGADAVVLAGDCVDAYNPKVVRSTTGSLFHLPIITVGSVGEVAQELAARSMAILVADMAGDPLPDVAGEGDLARPTAWVFGNEAHGVSPEDLAVATRVVSLPQYGPVESLNLATAAAVCLYQSAFAQRRAG